MWRFKRVVIKNLFSIKYAEYIFTNGRCIAVMGENKDWRKSGQKINGAGKSAFFEAISILLTGKTLRKLKNRSIIRNGENDCTIMCEMENSRLSDQMEIVRNLSKKESQSVGVEWNGVDQSDKFVDPNAANKFIIEKIGISNDDLLNYFIISRKRYVSFLSSSDTAKKELINRFSKANRLDDIDAIFDGKITALDKLLIDLNTSVTVKQSNRQLLLEQIQQYENLHFEKQKELAISALNEQYDEQLLKIDDLNNEIINEQIQLDEKNIELTKFSDLDLKKQVEAFNLREKEIKQQIEELNKKFKNAPTEFLAETQTIKEVEEDLLTQIAKLKLDIRSDEFLLDQLDKQLISFIECPNCNFKFSLKEKDKTIESINESIELFKKDKKIKEESVVENEDAVKELDDDKTKVNDKITKRRNELGKQIADIQKGVVKVTEDRGKVNIKIKEVEEKIKTCNFYIKQYANGITIKNRTIESMNKSLEQINEQIRTEEKKEPDNRVEQARLQANNIFEEIKLVQIQIEENDKQKSIELQWQLNFKSFKSYLANKSINAINGFINHYLENINSNLSLKMEGYKMDAKKKLKEEITVEVFRNLQPEGEFEKFSGGEQSRIDACSILALHKLINLSAKTGGLDFLGIDEILDAVDSYGLSLLIESLQNLNETIFIITQNTIDIATDVLLARKENDITELIYN